MTQFYVVAPPRQNEILYDEGKAVQRFQTLVTEQGQKRERASPTVV